jgi:hypothetical protein
MHKTSPNNNSDKNNENMKWERECYTIWKFLLINSTTSNNKIQFREQVNRRKKPFVKEEHEK